MSRPFLGDYVEPLVFATHEGHGPKGGVFMRISLESPDEPLFLGSLGKSISKKRTRADYNTAHIHLCELHISIGRLARITESPFVTQPSYAYAQGGP
jgi:hypothetical protein